MTKSEVLFLFLVFTLCVLFFICLQLIQFELFKKLSFFYKSYAPQTYSRTSAEQKEKVVVLPRFQCDFSLKKGRKTNMKTRELNIFYTRTNIEK